MISGQSMSNRIISSSSSSAGGTKDTCLYIYVLSQTRSGDEDSNMSLLYPAGGALTALSVVGLCTRYY